MIKWKFSQGYKDGSIFTNQYHVILIKNHMISIDTEKALDKIQPPFLINTLQEVSIVSSHLNITVAIYGQTHS